MQLRAMLVALVSIMAAGCALAQGVPALPATPAEVVVPPALRLPAGAEPTRYALSLTIGQSIRICTRVRAQASLSNSAH